MRPSTDGTLDVVSAGAGHRAASGIRTLQTLDKGLRDPVARDAATQPETVPAVLEGSNEDRSRSLPLRPARVHGVGEADIGVHGKQFWMAFSPHP